MASNNTPLIVYNRDQATINVAATSNLNQIKYTDYKQSLSHLIHSSIDLITSLSLEITSRPIHFPLTTTTDERLNSRRVQQGMKIRENDSLNLDDRSGLRLNGVNGDFSGGDSGFLRGVNGGLRVGESDNDDVDSNVDSNGDFVSGETVNGETHSDVGSNGDNDNTPSSVSQLTNLNTSILDSSSKSITSINKSNIESKNSNLSSLGKKLIKSDEYHKNSKSNLPNFDSDDSKNIIELNGSLKSFEKSKISDEEIPEFKILNIQLKSGHNDVDFGSSLNKNTISSILNKKLNQQIKYLLNLDQRINDTSSKVFVTGDLNSGKSTFCNALLKRKILPEDQQPCTSVFCEVIDASKENNSIEEVHAIPIGKNYSIINETTYEIHPLVKLEDLVYECDKYSLLKVYVLDHRSFNESLLNNGVIDIKLIDAPGLNMDSYQTTQVFSRQEEIDLIVFVVSSENHFTLSAKEFISAAAAEKRYVFIVVNRFDNIKDKEKCKNRILDQIKSLSPETYKSAKEFVHFVSSSEVFEGGNGDGPDDGDDDPDHKLDDNPDFDLLEASLRKFILDKRAISKLLPAKDYLRNILGDLEVLATLNEKIYAKEKEDKIKELHHNVTPKYDEIIKKSLKISDSITSLIENVCSDLYDNTKNDIYYEVNKLGDKQVVPFSGLSYLYEYAKETQSVMVNSILDSVKNSEHYAKETTSGTVDEIIEFGKSTLGEEFLNDKKFNSDLMFTRKKDSINRKLNETIEFSDFFDPSIESCLLWLGLPSEMISSTSAHMSQYNPASIVSNISSSAMTLKETIPSQFSLHTLYLSGKVLTTGAVIQKVYSVSHLVSPSMIKRVAAPILVVLSGFSIYYLISDIPNAYPRKLARKLKKQVSDLDYAHVNATRVSKECRQVLNYPSRQVMNNFQTSIDKRSLEKEKLEKTIKDAELSYGYFHDLLGKISYQRSLVEDIDIESLHTIE